MFCRNFRLGCFGEEAWGNPGGAREKRIHDAFESHDSNRIKANIPGAKGERVLGQECNFLPNWECVSAVWAAMRGQTQRRNRGFSLRAFANTKRGTGWKDPGAY